MRRIILGLGKNERRREHHVALPFRAQRALHAAGYSRMPVASTVAGCCTTAVCFHTPQPASSRKIPSETRESLRKFRHSKQANATATPGKTQMKYRLKKALVPSSASTNPASGMQRNSQPIASPAFIGCATLSFVVAARQNNPNHDQHEQQQRVGKQLRKDCPQLCERRPVPEAGRELAGKRKISGDKSAAGTTTPTAPATSFAEGRCQGFQRSSSHSA